jgi:hypothetical protein
MRRSTLFCALVAITALALIVPDVAYAGCRNGSAGARSAGCQNQTQKVRLFNGRVLSGGRRACGQAAQPARARSGCSSCGAASSIGAVVTAPVSRLLSGCSGSGCLIR